MSDHPVPVDEPGALAALDTKGKQDAAPGDSPGDTPKIPDAPDGAPKGEAWRVPCEFAASFLAHKITPAWEVDADTQKQWAHALAECADSMMPGGVGNVENWGPWGKLFFATGAWCMCGFDMERFKFKPLAEKPKAPPSAKVSADAADGANGEGAGPRKPVTTGGGFSTNA